MLFDYSLFQHATLSTLTYLLLAGSIVSLRFTRKPLIWGSLLAISIILGLFAERLHSFALLFITLLGCSTYLFYHSKNLYYRIFSGTSLFILSMLIFFHLLPGFSNWLVVNGLIVSYDAYPINMYFNFDKPLIGLFILGLSTLPLIKTRKEALALLKKTYQIALVGFTIIIVLSYQLGYIKFDLKMNNVFAIWVFNNLIFVCITEEVFFRGFFQHQLAIIFKKFQYGDCLAIFLAACLFVTIHMGGMKYMLLSGIAGILYGLVYQKTKRIEVSILVHFMLNTIHFIGFSYPALIAKTH